MPQPIHLRRDICGSLCLGLLWPQLLDHPVRPQSGLRIHVLKQNFQQLPELALVCEALAAQDSVDLLADGTGIHGSTDTMIYAPRIPQDDWWAQGLYLLRMPRLSSRFGRSFS